ncbi:MAG: ORF6N domain-containing protein [Betaproteobacteria bacterium]
MALVFRPARRQLPNRYMCGSYLRPLIGTSRIAAHRIPKKNRRAYCANRSARFAGAADGDPFGRRDMTKTGTHRAVAPLAVEAIATRIVLVRGQKVMLDSDLAALYGVPTRRLNEQVRRNVGRFPADVMFALTAAEFAALKSQFATSNAGSGRGGRRKLPLAFTEHGALMAATVLNSPRATEVAIYVVRAFVQLRDLLASNKELARQLRALEERLERRLDTHDQAIAGILDAIRQLMVPPPETRKRQIGFA